MNKLITFLEDIGCKKISVREDAGWVNSTCPLHEDTRKSFSFSLSDLHYHCFASCGKGSVIKLVMERFSFNLVKAVDFITDYLDLDTYTFDREDNDDTIQKRNKIKRDKYVASLLKYSIPTYWYDRGFTQNEWFENPVFYDDVNDYVVFKCGDAVFCRSTKQDFKKYVEGSDKAKSFFGFEKCLFDRPLIIVEGQFDCIKGRRFFGDKCDVISTLGVNYSRWQFNAICKYWDKIIIAYDKDTSGLIAAKKLGKDLIDKGKHIYYLRYPGNVKDMAEMNSKEGILFTENI